MLVFGPYSAIPRDSNFYVLNLTSPAQDIPRMPGLVVSYQPPSQYIESEYRENMIKEFDKWYFNYLFTNPEAYNSIMTIMGMIYEDKDVYICIADYVSMDYFSILNESFMKALQTRYDLKYTVINEASDLDCVNRDGCIFMSVRGIDQFDEDKMECIKAGIISRLESGDYSDLEEKDD